MTNLVKNGSFEETPWEDILIPGTWTRNQQPVDWEISWYDVGQVYRGSACTVVAEMVHKPERTLPEDEHMGGTDPLILDGITTYKIFGNGIFASQLTQTLTGLVPYEQIRVSVPVRCHHRNEKDPYGVEASLRVNKGYVWKNTPDLPDREWVFLETTTPADENGRINITITVDTKWQRPVDFFIDFIQLYYVDETVIDPPPDPEPPKPQPAPENWLWDIWPTHFPVIWQEYGENKYFDYTEFGQDYHCGMDCKSGLYGEIRAVSAGIITDIRYNQTGFGHHVIMRHNDRYSTTYAHMSQIYATIGMEVAAGFVLGLSGMTGNVAGEEQHLHISVTDHTGGDPGCYNKYVDPEPFYAHLFGVVPAPPPVEPPPAKDTRDLGPYFRGIGQYGPVYRVQHVTGPQEIFQVQSKPDGTFRLVKNHLFEELRIDNDHIWRGLDISPGPAPDYAERPGNDRIYTQFEDGQTMARWCRRHMAEGETFNGPGHNVQFMYKDNCQQSGANSGRATNNVQFVKHHARWNINGHILEDVIELFDSHERFWFQRGVGMVGWSSPWGISGYWEAMPNHDNLNAERGCWD